MAATSRSIERRIPCRNDANDMKCSAFLLPANQRGKPTTSTPRRIFVVFAFRCTKYIDVRRPLNRTRKKRSACRWKGCGSSRELEWLYNPAPHRCVKCCTCLCSRRYHSWDTKSLFHVTSIRLRIRVGVQLISLIPTGPDWRMKTAQPRLTNENRICFWCIFSTKLWKQTKLKGLRRQKLPRSLYQHFPTRCTTRRPTFSMKVHISADGWNMLCANSSGFFSERIGAQHIGASRNTHKVPTTLLVIFAECSRSVWWRTRCDGRRRRRRRRDFSC